MPPTTVKTRVNSAKLAKGKFSPEHTPNLVTGQFDLKWPTVTVSNFGPFPEGHIELRPLTVFTGLSGTGKTALAKTIYAIKKSLMKFKRGIRKLSKRYQASEHPDFIKDDLHEEFQKCFGARYKELLVRHGCRTAKVEFSLPLSPYRNYVWELGKKIRAQNKLINNKLFQELSQQQGILAADFEVRHPAYLPAARSVLAKVNAKAKSSYSDLSGLETDYLSLLIRLKKAAASQKNSNIVKPNIIDMFENRILNGHVSVGKFGSKQSQFRFTPKDSRKQLSLFETSPKIAGLMPLVMYMKYCMNSDEVLFLEEPEAHLDPEAQIELIQLLARSVKLGLHVVMTTHSEWMTEMLSNIVARAESQEKPNGKASLAEKNVGVWLFDRVRKGKSKGSKVSELKWNIDKGGYEPGYANVMTDYTNEWFTLSRIVANNAAHHPS